MAKTKIKFLQKPTCTTCRKAKDYLEKLGAELELRSLDAEPLSEAELDHLIGNRDYKLFLSQRNELYRTKNMRRIRHRERKPSSTWPKCRTLSAGQ